MLDRDGVDVDLHVLRGREPDACVARYRLIARRFEPGSYTIVVDTFRGAAGEYELVVSDRPTPGP